jgi:hypothetical protein
MQAGLVRCKLGLPRSTKQKDDHGAAIPLPGTSGVCSKHVLTANAIQPFFYILLQCVLHLSLSFEVENCIDKYLSTKV